MCACPPQVYDEVSRAIFDSVSLAQATKILQGVRDYIAAPQDKRTVCRLRRMMPLTLPLEEDEGLIDELNAQLTIWLNYASGLIDVLAFFATPAGCFRNRLTGTFINERLHRTRKHDDGTKHTNLDGSAVSLVLLCAAQTRRKVDNKSLRQARARSKHLAASR